MPIEQNQNFSRTTLRLKAWIALFRPPNLFTVPGDPLAGVLLAASAQHVTPSWNSVYAVMGAALAFYASGLLANDFFDRNIDARERPSRPIPSGAVKPNTVKWGAILLSLTGLLLSLAASHITFAVGLLLALAIWYYNAFGKKIAWLAPFSMGICRGLSLTLGASVLGMGGITTHSVLIAAFFLTLFIALITMVARYEATPEANPLSNWSRWGIPILLTIWLMLFLFKAGSTTELQWKSLSVMMTVMSVLWAIIWTGQMKPHAPARVIQSSVGNLIRGLLFTQAALCTSYGGTGEGFALGLLFLFPVSGWIGKWFYGS